MAEQKPEYDVEPFSFFNNKIIKDQLSCFITYTNARTHRLIKKNLNQSPLYTGKIRSKGVRYCPSLEDKVVKFPAHERHQIFIEPEGWDSLEVYPNGISTSLPFSVQEKFIHSIDGLQAARIIRPGYGIEHGVIDSRQLKSSLEARMISGLYFAGQVNGTTGYEEAAAQGLIAGINAALQVKRKKPFILTRDDAFIGVLIDDLTSKGTDEPYRMFTSRSELRLRLRESNAIFRLSPYGYKLGLISKKDYNNILAEEDKLKREIQRLKSTKVFFHGKKQSLADILKRPQFSLKDIAKFTKVDIADSKGAPEVEITIKYEGFIRREDRNLKSFSNLKKVKIPADLNFNTIPSLSREVRDKLNFSKPANLKDAFQISGITPAAILAVYNFIVKKYSKKG
jgi:tRNA uridine 5-carboxymethylaminomethyl modification enzyme